MGEYQSVKEIWEFEKESMERAVRLIPYLTEDQFDIDELEQVLKEIFMNDIDILKNVSANVRSDIRRLIRIYDYLKWGKVKELSD